MFFATSQHPHSKQAHRIRAAAHPLAFTLAEVLVSVAILTILALAMIQILNQSSKMWTRTQDKFDTFREARAALHRIAADLRRAHITAYSPMAINPTDDGTLLPSTPANRSSIFFIAKQPAIITDAGSPIAITDIADLCAIGYYTAYAPDSYNSPPGPANPSRFNLYRYYRGSEITANYIMANRYAHAAFWLPNNLSAPQTSITPPSGLGLPSLLNTANAPFLNPTNATQALSRPDDLLARNIANLKIVVETASTINPQKITTMEDILSGAIPTTSSTTLPTAGELTLTEPTVLYIGLTTFSDQTLGKLGTISDWSDPSNIAKYGRIFSLRVDLPAPR
jgi:type II secretory pathway pseudopilin PulG